MSEIARNVVSFFYEPDVDDIPMVQLSNLAFIPQIDEHVRISEGVTAVTTRRVMDGVVIRIEHDLQYGQEGSTQYATIYLRRIADK